MAKEDDDAAEHYRRQAERARSVGDHAGAERNEKIAEGISRRAKDRDAESAPSGGGGGGYQVQRGCSVLAVGLAGVAGAAAWAAWRVVERIIL